MTEKEQQFNQWFDEYANGVKVFEEADMKQAYLQGRAELEKENAELKEINSETLTQLNLDNGELIIENAKLREELNYAKSHCLFHSDCPTQKENAELKRKLNVFSNESANACFAHNEKSKQLTNAKELLNMFLRLHYNPIVDEHTLFCKVEQFLNSEVEKWNT